MYIHHHHHNHHHPNHIHVMAPYVHKKKNPMHSSDSIDIYREASVNDCYEETSLLEHPSSENSRFHSFGDSSEKCRVSFSEKKFLAPSASVQWADKVVSKVRHIEKRREIDREIVFSLWYRRNDYAIFESHDFNVFGEFREVFRGAHIEQCEEWFINQRGESLRGLECLENGSKRSQELRLFRNAVLSEQERQRNCEINFNPALIAEIATNASDEHREIARKKGIFDEEVVRRLNERELRQSNSDRSTSSRKNGLWRRMQSNGEVLVANEKLHQNLKSSSNSSNLSDKKKKKKKWFTVRVKKR